MIHVRLPEKIRFICPACRESFELRATLLNDRTSLSCPACAATAGIYEMLECRLRRRLYHAVRDELENRIHLAQNTDSGNQPID